MCVDCSRHTTEIKQNYSSMDNIKVRNCPLDFIATIPAVANTDIRTDKVTRSVPAPGAAHTGLTSVQNCAKQKVQIYTAVCGPKVSFISCAQRSASRPRSDWTADWEVEQGLSGRCE
jgi:hypothetical protein